jgi:hypothetical protein
MLSDAVHINHLLILVSDNSGQVMTLAVVDVTVMSLYPILGLGNGGALGNRQAHLMTPCERGEVRESYDFP